MTDIPTAEIEYLAKSEALQTIFDGLERDALEELLRLPMWASRKRKDALVMRMTVLRDVRQRIRFLKATSGTSGQRIG